MRSLRILPLLAMISLPGCDATSGWLRAPATGTAHAAQLASDTTVVTTRRVPGMVTERTGNDRMSTIMPDGAGMAVMDPASGDLAVFDLASGELSRFRVTDDPRDPGVALFPLASPDGSRIAFVWVGRLEPEWHLRVVDVATGETRTLLTRDTTHTGQPFPVAWTPAGDSMFAWISDEGGDAEVVLTPTAGGTARRVHTIPRDAANMMPHMSLSPDGRWLLYTHELSRDQQSRSDIYVIDVQGGGARPLVQHPAIDVLVGWLPGTDVVLFSSDRSGTTDLWSVRVANGRASAEPRLVRSGFFRSEPVGFGGGALFYRVTTGSSGAAIVNVDPQSGALLGAASPPLADMGAFYRGLAWSPDGNTLAALTRQRGATVTLHSTETGKSRVFWLDRDVTPHAVQWAADGQALFLRVGEAGSTPNSPNHFLRLDLVTGTTTRPFAAADPGDYPLGHLFRVTPDGRSVVLLRQLGTVDDERTGVMLVLRSLEDGSERELHRTSGFIVEFNVSPNGLELAFMQQTLNDSDSLFVMSMDGSQPLRSVARWDTDEVTVLGWLPAGNALLATRLTADRKAEEILRVELDGSTSVVGISPFRPGRGSRVPGYHRSRLVLSPAGNRIVNMVNDTGTEFWRMDGLHELFARDSIGRR
jgi:dipeptidyl aminopeptidase/acylaminoacyl peptidase